MRIGRVAIFFCALGTLRVCHAHMCSSSSTRVRWKCFVALRKPALFIALALAVANIVQASKLVADASSKCTSNSTFSNCLFPHACLETKGNNVTWTAESLPYEDWRGVSRAVKRIGSGVFGRFDGCDDPFLPEIKRHEEENESPSVFLSGTYVYLCVWIHHFGHSMMDHLYPAFDLIQTMAERGGKEVTLLVDPQIRTSAAPQALTMDILSVLGPVRTVQEMSHWAQEKGIDSVCFERMLVGMKRTGVSSHDDVPQGGYNAMRNFVYGRLGIKNASVKKACSFILVNRAVGSRVISNAGILLQELTNALPSHCAVDHIDFDGAFADQIKKIASTSGIISIASSASHQMIWLPDGAFSLVIDHPFHNDTNSMVCKKMHNVLCLRARSTVADETDIPDDLSGKMSLSVVADVSEVLRQFRIGLSWQRENKNFER